MEQVYYMDLMLIGGDVHESAVRNMLNEVLHDRGTVPVGEVGKILQDMVTTVNLSGKLKEKFGGLKKYLGKHPKDFTICADHPFNPHIFMTPSLTPEDLEMIEKGVIPPDIMAKNKKVSV